MKYQFIQRESNGMLCTKQESLCQCSIYSETQNLKKKKKKNQKTWQHCFKLSQTWRGKMTSLESGFPIYKLTIMTSTSKCWNSDQVECWSAHAESLSHVWLFTNPMNCSPPGSSVHRILQQEYWSGLPFVSPGDLTDPRIKPTSPVWQQGSLPLSHQGTHNWSKRTWNNWTLAESNWIWEALVVSC